MLKGIFCHDLPVYKDVNGVYCSTTLTNSFFERYLTVVDELTVATRVYPLDTTYDMAGQEKIDLSGIKFLDLPNVNTIKAFFGTIQSVKNILIQEIQKVDAVFIRGGTIALIGGKVAWSLKKPYLFECGGSAWDAYWNHSCRGKLLAPIMEIGNRKLAKNAAMVVYVTKKWLQKKYPTKGIAIDASDVFIKTDEQILEKRLIHVKKKDSPLVIGTTAAIDVKYKGQEYIIHAIGMLKDRLEIRYELVGGGNVEYLQSVANKCGVTEKVRFKGQLTHEDVLKWLDTIDIYVQPSITEGLPRALVEAMSRGCLAIGTDVGGIPELLGEDFLFRKKDSRHFVERVNNLLTKDMLEVAKGNFEKAKEFDSNILNKKRKDAFAQYIQIVLEGK